MVGHTNGYHEVDLTFCGCISPEDGIVHDWAQLMRHGWYPASRQRITTAFTFRMLDFFQELTLQSKVSLYDFNRTLCRVTDNSGVRACPVSEMMNGLRASSLTIRQNRYKQLAVVIRQWRNLTLLKRSGRGHDPSGIETTSEGACVVECAACPHPGRNLPADWFKAPPGTA